MTTPKEWLSRRPVLAGLVAVTAAVAAGIGVDLIQPKHKRATGPYADLIDLTGDPESARTLGLGIYKQIHSKVCVPHLNDRAATELRHKIARSSFASVIESEIATGHLLEIDSWVLPETLGVICYLAAADRELCS